MRLSITQHWFLGIFEPRTSNYNLLLFLEILTMQRSQFLQVLGKVLREISKYSQSLFHQESWEEIAEIWRFFPDLATESPEELINPRMLGKQDFLRSRATCLNYSMYKLCTDCTSFWLQPTQAYDARNLIFFFLLVRCEVRKEVPKLPLIYLFVFFFN